MAGPWPLVGRDRELALFGDLLGSGARRAVVLAGGAGVGKTRLATELLAAAEARGLATARVKGNAAARRLPFLALGPLLPAAVVPGVEPAEMLRRAVEAIVDVGDGRELVLLVDDAHLLDDASATVVHQLAATRAAFVVATVRSEERAPDPVVALWKDELAERVEVLPLPRATVEALLGEALGGPVSAATARLLAERSAGNTMYLRELVLAGVESGALTDDGGVWRMQGSVVVSSRLVELIEARIGGVLDPERRVLEALAIAERLGVSDLLELIDGKRLGKLEARGLVVTTDDGRRLEAALAHPLYGEVIRTRIPAIRARASMLNLADRLERTGARRRDDVLRLATWRLDSGGAPAPDLALSASVAALNRWDLSLAARLADAAEQAGAGFDATMLGAEIAVLQGRGAEAEATLALLVPLATDDGRRARVVGARVDNLVSSLGRIDDALQVIVDAEAVVTDRTASHQLRAKRGFVLYMGGRLEEALDVLAPVLAHAEGAALALACYVAGGSLVRAGRFDEAVTVAARIDHPSTLPSGAQPSMRPSLNTVVRCSALIGAGRLVEAEARATRDHDAGVAVGSMTVQALFSLVRAQAHLAMGDIAAAARDAREARNLFGGKQWRLLYCSALNTIALAEALGGAEAEARAALAEVDGLGLAGENVHSVDLRVARAWTEVAAGRMAAARTHLLEAAAVARHRGDAVAEGDALHAAARLGWPEEAAPRLRELAKVVEGELAPARADHVDAVLRGDAADLSEVSIVFEVMGARLLAAEAAATAAVVLRRAGHPRQAAAAEQRAAGLARTCRGAITPALRAIETQAVLSAREIEVAALAAAGLANKEIAARLVVSVRTVENHLQRVYEKLGVARRADLGQALSSVEIGAPAVSTRYS